MSKWDPGVKRGFQEARLLILALTPAGMTQRKVVDDTPRHVHVEFENDDEGRLVLSVTARRSKRDHDSPVDSVRVALAISSEEGVINAAIPIFELLREKYGNGNPCLGSSIWRFCWVWTPH